MRALNPPSRARGRIWVGCVILAAVASAGLAAAGPAAVAAPAAPSASTASSHAAAVAGTPTGGQVTWSLVPATSKGPDSRSQFDYGTVKPGSTITDHVELVNRSSTSASFSVYATDASGTTPQGGLLLLPSGQKPKDVGAWSSFPGGAQQLSTNPPASRALIQAFTIKVPALATPGDHTGAMIAAVGVPHRSSTGAIIIQTYRIAVPIEFRIPGALHSGLQVQSISTGFSDPLNPFGSGTATVSYSIANTGNVRLAGTPTVSVTGSLGQSGVVHPAKLPLILPGDSVRVSVTVSGLFPAGPMTAHVGVTGGWPAHTIALSTPIPTVSGQASLFAFPWSLLGLILLLVAIGVGIWYCRRWRGRMRRAELAAVAARASRDTERRLLSGRAPANGQSANGHSVSGDGAKPTSGAKEASAAPSEAEAAPPESEAGPAPAEATAPAGTVDGGDPAAEGTSELWRLG